MSKSIGIGAYPKHRTLALGMTDPFWRKHDLTAANKIGAISILFANGVEFAASRDGEWFVWDQRDPILEGVPVSTPYRMIASTDDGWEHVLEGGLYVGREPLA